MKQINPFFIESSASPAAGANSSSGNISSANKSSSNPQGRCPKLSCAGSTEGSRLWQAFFWTTRLTYCLFCIFSIFALSLANGLVHDDDDVILQMTLTSGNSYSVVPYISTCQLASDDLSTTTNDQNTVAYLKGNECTNLSVVLHIVSIAAVLGILALIIYMVVYMIVHNKVGNRTSLIFYKGALAGLGGFGAFVLFLSGWALFAVGWFAEANVATWKKLIDQSNELAGNTVVLSWDEPNFWAMFGSGSIGMVRSSAETELNAINNRRRLTACTPSMCGRFARLLCSVKPSSPSKRRAPRSQWPSGGASNRSKYELSRLSR